MNRTDSVTCKCLVVGKPDPKKAGWDDQGWHVVWKDGLVVEATCPNCLRSGRAARAHSFIAAVMGAARASGRGRP